MLNRGIGGVKKVPSEDLELAYSDLKRHMATRMPRRNRRWVVLWETAVEEDVKGRLKEK
jgi:hypothetical protein